MAMNLRLSFQRLTKMHPGCPSLLVVGLGTTSEVATCLYTAYVNPSLFVAPDRGRVVPITGIDVTYHVFIPTPLPRRFDLAPDMQLALSTADMALGRLAGAQSTSAQPTSTAIAVHSSRSRCKLHGSRARRHRPVPIGGRREGRRPGTVAENHLSRYLSRMRSVEQATRERETWRSVARSSISLQPQRQRLS